MIKGFNHEFYKIEGDLIILGNDESVKASSVKAVFVDAVGHDAVPDNDNLYVVRLKTIDNKLYKVCRGNVQHLASETIKSMAKWLGKFGDFKQYGSSILNLALVDRQTLSRDDNAKVSAVFKDNDAIVVVNTPFPRVAWKTYEKLKSDIIKYKTHHVVPLK